MVRKQGSHLRQEGGDTEAGFDLLIPLKDKLGAEAVVLPTGRGGQVTPKGRATRKWLRTKGTQRTIWGFTLRVQKPDCIGITLGMFEKQIPTLPPNQNLWGYIRIWAYFFPQSSSNAFDSRDRGYFFFFFF